MLFRIHSASVSIFPSALHVLVGGFHKISFAAISSALRVYRLYVAYCLCQSNRNSFSGVRCHRTRLETRTEELHSAASGKGKSFNH